jgi:BR serine/threonine kinase
MALRGRRIGKYELSATIGAGPLGKVKIGTDPETNRKYAIKILSKDLLNRKGFTDQQLKRVIAMVRVLEHPNLIRYIDLLESRAHFYIVLEFAEHGEVFDYVLKRTRLEVPAALSVFRSIIFGLDFLHSRAMCHGDLKPENILLDVCDQAKITDFAIAIDPKSRSPYYTAPEILRGGPCDGRAADVWSCGVILFGLLAGRLPFDDRSIKTVVGRIKSGVFVMPEFDLRIQNLIARMLTVDVNRRITLGKIKEHEAFRMDVGNLSYCVPTPWLLPVSHDPIQISAGDVSSLRLLRSFGYESDEEIMGELLSTGDTTAKRIWQLVSCGRRMSPRWGEEDGEPTEPIPVSAEMIEEETPVGEPKDHFYRRHQPIGQPSLGAYSMARPAGLPSLGSADNVEISRNLKHNGTRENLVGALQEVLASRGFQWSYPNPRDLFARNSERGFEVEFRVEYHAVGQLAVGVTLVEGDEDLFERIVDDIDNYLKSLNLS